MERFRQRAEIRMGELIFAVAAPGVEEPPTFSYTCMAEGCAGSTGICHTLGFIS